MKTAEADVGTRNAFRSQPREPFQFQGVLMLGQQSEGSIPEHIRQKMFHLLVTGQDMEMTVAESRRMITDKFGVSEDQVRRVEREGIQRGWLNW
jgi:hypothetical protein